MKTIMKIKTMFALFTCLAFCLDGWAQQKYEINGTVKSMPNYKVTVTLYYSSSTGQFKSEISVVTDGKFKFTGEVPKPQGAFLAMTDGEDNLNAALGRGANDPNAVKLVQIGMYLEEGNITAVLDHEKQTDAVITGTPQNNSFQQFRPVMEKYKKLEASIYARNKAAAGDAAKTDALLTEYNKMVGTRAVEIGELIKKNPESLGALDLLGRWIDPAVNLAGAKKYFAYLSTDRQNSAPGQRYQARIKRAGITDIDAMAPDFTMSDVNGKPSKLSDYKGKYVLLDFWASWCVPCRKETPNLISAYKEYKDKNFEILAVSLDGGKADSREQWLGAIKTDQMTWPQLSDLQGFDSNIVSAYAISAIPMNFLIDPSGKIIAKNLRGQELKDTLAKLLQASK